MSIERGRTSTEWFRTPRYWPYLTEHLAHAEPPVTVVSLGCATGEESYTAAMCLVHARIPGHVFASDADDTLTATARRGQYANLAGIPADYRQYIRSNGRVTDDVRARVTFSTYRFGSPEPIPPCDLLLARNLWRFVPHHERDQAATHAHDAIGTTGLMLTGGSDYYAPAGAFWLNITPPQFTALFDRDPHLKLLLKRKKPTPSRPF